MRVRRINVKPGDVFEAGPNGGFVVEALGIGRAVGRYSGGSPPGRLTRISILRLQREYNRLGELASARCHRALAQVDKQKRAPQVRD